MAKATLEEREEQVARLSRENGTLRRLARDATKARASIERAVALHSVGGCGCATDRECLVRLARLVRIPALDAARPRKVGR